jgi:hypothetical protein
VRESDGTLVAGLLTGTMLVCDVRAHRTWLAGAAPEQAAVPVGAASGTSATPLPGSSVAPSVLDAAIVPRARFSSRGERFARVAIGPSSMAGGCFDGRCYVWSVGQARSSK